MSVLAKLEKSLVNLPSILEEYELALNDVDNILKLRGKTIERANQENPAWVLYYSTKKIELDTLCNYMEMQVARVKGKLFKSYTETYSRELSERAKEKYIDNEEAYLSMLELFLEVKEVLKRYEVVVDALNARGYALNNITRARVADVHANIID